MERKRSVGAAGGGPARGAAAFRPEVTSALSASLFREWAQTGFGTLSLETVARNAGVGKAALYRRWRDKTSMVTELLEREGLALTEVEDAGSLVGDIRATLLAIRRVLRHRVIRAIVADLVGESGRGSELGIAIKPFQAARRARADRLIDRAITRGELTSAIDRELAADLLAAPLFWRLVVLGRRATIADIDRLATASAAALIALH